MNVGSLFSGIGGIELGFKREGFRTSWFVENNPYCQEVLKRHFPAARIYGDITKLDFSTLPEVSVLTGGFPCQDISTAGKQAGIRGKRSGLWKYYAEAIRVLRPKVALVENVPALAYLGLDEVLADVAEIGYDAEWFNLSASAFGAPHRRERIFILAYPQRSVWWGKVQPKEAYGLLDKNHDEVAHGNGRKNVGRNAKPFFIADNSGIGFFGEKPMGEQSAQDRKPAFKDIYRRIDGGKPFFIADDWGDRIQRFKYETLHGKQGFQRFKDVGSVEELFKRPDIPEPLIRRGGNGLSARMDAYLQKERIQAIGNAVVPVCAQFIARRIKEVIKR